MKKFNFSKGLVIGLLTLALCLTCFAATKVSAAKGDKHKITFVASADSEVTFEVEYTEGEIPTEGDPIDPTPNNIAMEDIIAGLNKKDGVIYVKGTGSISGGDACLNISDTGVILLPAAKTDYTLTVPVKAPVVTFNVTVKDLTKTGDGLQYSYKADTTFQKKGASLTVASILENLKNGETPLDDPTAWLYYSHTKNDEKFTMTAEKVTLAADLTTDLTINAVVVNSKLVQKFTYGDYTAEFEVDNKKGTNQILFTDIIDKLAKPGEEEDETISYVSENGDSVILAEGFAGAATTKGKYTTWYYPVNVAGTQNAALAATPIVAEKIVPMFDKKETGYEPATDSIKFVSPVDLDLYWIDCKSTKGVQVKGEKLKTLSLAQNKEKTAYEGYIPLNDKDAGVKVAESKATYIYASYKAPAEDKAKYTANYIVDATPYKKIAVTFRYAQAEAATKENEAPLEEGAIATITTIGTDKKTHIYAGEYDQDTNKDYFLDAILGDLQYSEDGSTWYDIMGNEIGTDKVNHDLNLNKLYEIVSGGSKVNLYFRIVGAEALEEIPAIENAEDVPETPWVESEGRAAKNAYRATKPVKVAVANAKAAKAVKVDVTKSTIALKNGYDFAMTDKDTDTPSIEGAFTILPFNKLGKSKELILENEEWIEGDDTELCRTSDYVPVAKVTENAKVFTNIKVKTYSIDDIAMLCNQSPGGSGNLYIWIRKSATAKKPAELWTLVTVTQIAEAPVATADKTTGYYAVQEVDDTKGVIKGIEVTNAKSDKNEGSFEYLIVDAKDIKAVEESNPVVYYADIDFTSAKWTALSDKGLTVGKSKSKYSNKEGVKASDHTLAAGSVVLIRRAGIKDGNVLASNYTITMIVKEDVSYKDAEGKDQKKALFVWKAFVAAAE